MNILLTGASGLIGRAINSELTKQGNTVYPLVRNRREGPFFYMQETDEIFLDQSIHLGAVINLAGVNISERRWNPKVKEHIVQSRVRTTEILSDAIANLKENQTSIYQPLQSAITAPTQVQFFQNPARPEKIFLPNWRWTGKEPLSRLKLQKYEHAFLDLALF